MGVSFSRGALQSDLRVTKWKLPHQTECFQFLSLGSFRGGLLRVRFPANLTATWAHLAIKLNPGFGRPRSVLRRSMEHLGYGHRCALRRPIPRLPPRRGAPDPGRLGLVDGRGPPRQSPRDFRLLQFQFQDLQTMKPSVESWPGMPGIPVVSLFLFGLPTFS